MPKGRCGESRTRSFLAAPAAVLDYLSRHTHRTAIGNERLLAIDGDKVMLRVRTDDSGGKRVIALDGKQFVARFLQHVLPPGFKRIRHYGLLAPAAKTPRLALARRLLAMPAANPQAREDAQAFMRRVAAIEIERCPHCKTGRWQLMQTLRADRQALALLPPVAACRSFILRAAANERYSFGPEMASPISRTLQQVGLSNLLWNRVEVLWYLYFTLQHARYRALCAQCARQIKRLIVNVRAGLSHVRATAPQLDKPQRWVALVRYIVERILACQPKPNLGLTALGSG